MAYPRSLTEKKEAAVAAAYAKGKSSAELSEKFGIHRSTVVAICQRAGVPLRERGGSKPKKTVKATVKTGK